MAKGQPKKQLEPRVGDVVKVIGHKLFNSKSWEYGVVERTGGWASETDTDRCMVKPFSKNSKQAILNSDLLVLRGGVATNIRRKHDKDFKDAE